MQTVDGNPLLIGVLALQGSVDEHLARLKSCGVNGIAIKHRHDLDRIHGLIIPGGESTTIGKLLRDFNLLDDLRQKTKEGLPTWGTCAGMILMAKEIDSEVPYLGVMNICVKRNAYGTQINSFKTQGIIPTMGLSEIPFIFIRAPYISKFYKPVKILYSLNNHMIAAQENHMLVTSFHPELTQDNTVHHYFISMVKAHLNPA
jgi:5'-phosphate synthase pdxT subunit